MRSWHGNLSPFGTWHTAGASAPAFSPTALFSLSEPGIWLDPSDLTTLFQDTAGNQPVTTPGQTVALALDKSKGLVLGPELVSNGDFSSATGWTTSNVTIAGGVATITGAAPSLTRAMATTSGRTYRVSITVSGLTGGSLWLRFIGGTAANSGFFGNGTITFLLVSNGNTSLLVEQFSGSISAGTIDNISVRELPGNHATQATAASRPIYGVVPSTGRRNLLTYTEQFDNAAWIKSGAAVTANQAANPLGSANDADKVDATGATSGVYITSSGNILSGVDATFSVWVKSATGSNQTIRLRGQTGSGVNVFSPNITATSDWQRVSFTWTSSSTFQPTPGILTDASGTAFSVFVWGAQLELGSTATPYQRVVSQYDVTEAGVSSLSYLAFDGVDDFLVTPTITPGTDKAQVFAGVRKLSDAALGYVLESSTTLGSNNGTIYLAAPITISGANYGFTSKGTSRSDSTSLGSFSAPITNVITGIGDISGDNAILRVNGTQAAQSTADQGTGNFLAYPIYIGRRGGTTLPFNGRIYSLIARFGDNLTNTQITNTETWVNGKTGAY